MVSLFFFFVGKAPPSKDLSMSIQLAGVMIIITIFNGVIILHIFYIFVVGKEAPSKELSMNIQLGGGYYHSSFILFYILSYSILYFIFFNHSILFIVITFIII